MNIIIKSTHDKFIIETGGMQRETDFRYCSDRFGSSIDTNNDKESLNLMSMCRGLENVVKHNSHELHENNGGMGDK